MKEPLEAIAIDFEKDPLLFFYELLNVTPPTSREAAQAVIAEEKRHVQLLSDRRKRFAARA